MTSDDILIQAEQIVLGAMLTDPSVIIPVAAIIDTGDDFYRPAHALIFDAITAARAAGDDTGPVAIAIALGADLSVCGGAPYLHTLLAAVPVAASAPYYARQVRDAATRRRIQSAGLTLAGLTEGTDADAAELLARARTILDGAAGDHRDDTADVMDIAAFVAADFPYGDPVIPGLLHQQERVVVVAGEGGGKTTLALQTAVMTAAGLHPLTGTYIEPAVTLIIDLENPSASVQRRLARLLDVAATVDGWNPARCHVWSRPGGVDLRSPQDQRQVMNVVARTGPQLIVAGPLYKMAVDRGERAEQLHFSVAAFWDKIRERHGSALWLEGHAPVGSLGGRDLRPAGSGVWLRWPEFGITLRPSDEPLDAPGTMKLGTFRGHREDRVWPVKLVRSRPWSWSGVYSSPVYPVDGA